MTQYFRNFPIVEYRGSFLKNIMKRARFNDRVKNYYTAFYPYTVQNGDRLDIIAEKYYGRSSSMWIIQLLNDIIDPYYDFPLSDENFKSYIIKKYGTIREAHRKILFYRNNWDEDFSNLSVAGFNALSEMRKSYWDYVVGENNTVLLYVRKRENWIAATNKIISADFTSELEGNTFIKDERVYISGDEDSYAFVNWANSTVINLHHIQGDFASTLEDANTVIIGETSEVEATIDSGTYKLLANVINAEVASYYSPVFAYDFEEEINAKKKEILILDESQEVRVSDELFKIMKE